MLKKLFSGLCLVMILMGFPGLSYSENLAVSYDPAVIKERYLRAAANAYLEKIKNEVSLSEDQAKSLQPAVVEAFMERDQLSQENITASARTIEEDKISEKFRNKVSFVLSPDQYQLFLDKEAPSPSSAPSK